MRRKDSERPALLSGRQRASPSHIWGCLLNTGFWKACRKASVGPLEGLARNDFPRHHLAMHPSLINKGRPSTSARAMPFLVQTLDHAKPREPLTTPRVISVHCSPDSAPQTGPQSFAGAGFFWNQFLKLRKVHREKFERAIADWCSTQRLAKEAKTARLREEATKKDVAGTQFVERASGSMSTRGINFLDRWLANNVPGTTKADVISVDELTHKLIADAKAIAPSAGRLMKRSTASIARSSMSSST